MNFEWDANKNLKNIEKHGIDFNDATQAFDNPMIRKVDNRKDYRETRWIAIGLLIDFVIVIVYTIKDKVIRFISVRKANKKERKKYYDTFEKNGLETSKKNE